MNATIQLTVDDRETTVAEGMTILEAARQAGIQIPSLCHHPNLRPTASCGVCVVEIAGMPGPKRACCTPAEQGMKVTTNSKALRSLRKTLVELILSNHATECPTCAANGKCELQDLANAMGVDFNRFTLIVEDKPIDESSPSVHRDPRKCIACGRCVTVCSDIQSVWAIDMVNRGFDVNVNTFFKEGLGRSACVNCGQCTVFCPTGALRERSETDAVWDAILDPNKIVVVQEAPAIRVTLAEEFGMEMGMVTVGKMYAALKKIGFDYVFDTNFTADLTIMEEGTELIERVKSGGALPLITSCSPGWIKFMETYFPGFAGHISTCKSPQQMFGTMVKTYFAREKGLDPGKIVSVSIMPCTAKKFEARRPEMRDSGYQDVDHVLTTREFVRMIKEAKIDFRNLPEEKADDLMAAYTGAATIFGATGGVMEAAIRSAYFLLAGKNLDNLDVRAVRGLEGIKEASLGIPAKGLGDLTVKVAVAHGLGNARALLDKVQKQIQETGKSEYAFIEIMACPGGCVGGGGQPYGSVIADRARRGEGLYREDSGLAKRQSHENPEVQRIYEKFLQHPGSDVSHKLLHTCYFERSLLDGACVKEVTHKHSGRHG
ncbi:MAG TPA: NADH-dependent [FeFe] hydrogenase, group A6 [Candidatus Aminicenantes bacterium]|nr:NADH-dependent [FeFe] hydrogenase, group A6 [Candidatus Aminicenantes bacterium]